MEHILETSHNELERTHRLVENYKARHLKSLFFSFFPGSFKKVFAQFASIKEELILEYQELHNSIHAKKLDPLSDQFIFDELTSITKKIETCSELLSKLVTHSYTQADILLHEKVFFVKLLESFHDDILAWVGMHEEEVFWEQEEIAQIDERNPITRSIKILRQKKEHLEKYKKEKK